MRLFNTKKSQVSKEQKVIPAQSKRISLPTKFTNKLGYTHPPLLKAPLDDLALRDTVNTSMWAHIRLSLPHESAKQDHLGRLRSLLPTIFLITTVKQKGSKYVNKVVIWSYLILVMVRVKCAVVCINAFYEFIYGDKYYDYITY